MYNWSGSIWPMTPVINTRVIDIEGVSQYSSILPNTTRNPFIPYCGAPLPPHCYFLQSPARHLYHLTFDGTAPSPRTAFLTLHSHLHVNPTQPRGLASHFTSSRKPSFTIQASTGLSHSLTRLNSIWIIPFLKQVGEWMDEWMDEWMENTAPFMLILNHSLPCSIDYFMHKSFSCHTDCTL